MVVGRRVETIQITTLLRTARILRRVLETRGDLLSLKPEWKTIGWKWCENSEGVNNISNIMPFSHILENALWATNLLNRQHQTICKERKKIGDSNTNNKDIQSRYRNGILHRKMCYAYYEKWGRQIMKGAELPNQDRIRTLGEKETYKYLGILKADTLK